MTSRWRRLSVQQTKESPRSGVLRLRLVLALFAAMLMLVAAACGSDDNSKSSASSGGSSSSDSNQAAKGDQAAKSGDTTVSAGVTDYLKYVDGKAGAADPSKSPITIGWVNQQGGPTDIGPWATDGAKLAVKWLNEKAGGIGGHPVKLVTCFTSTSEEQGQTCGQKMANNKDVKVIGVGAVAIGSQSLNATVDGKKPMVFGVSVGQGDAKNTNGYALFGDGIRVSGPFGTYAADVLHAKKAAIIWPELPGINESSQAIVDGAKKKGIDVKAVSYSPNATDLVGPLTAAGAQSADVIILNSDPKGCVNVAKALKQLNLKTPVLSEPLCLNTDVAKALGDIPQWTYGIASTLAADQTDPTAKVWNTLADQMGDKAKKLEPWYTVAFHQMLTIFQWMNKIGPDKVSEQTIAEQAKAFKGPQAWGAPTLQCGKYPEAPAICNDQTKFFNYEGKGKFTAAGGWQRSPE
jgi:branched-chain amino acid transport system substrate-binding protein